MAQVPENEILDVPFSLAPSLFLPLTSFPPTPHPTSIPAKLRTILQNVSDQQSLTRYSIYSSLKSRADALIIAAKADLASLAPELQYGNAEEKTKREEKKAVEEMFGRVREKARKGEDFEIKAGFGVDGMVVPIPIPLSQPFSPFQSQGQAQSQQLNHPPYSSNPTSRTTSQNSTSKSRNEIITKLRRDLTELIVRGTTDLECYDLECKKVLDYYQSALERQVARGGDVTVAGGNAGGMAGPGTGPAMGEIRRLSNGMPIPGVVGVQQGRRGSLDEARRGSR